jgi:hypothetical protein
MVGFFLHKIQLNLECIYAIFCNFIKFKGVLRIGDGQWRRRQIGRGKIVRKSFIKFGEMRKWTGGGEGWKEIWAW